MAEILSGLAAGDRSCCTLATGLLTEAGSRSGKAVEVVKRCNPIATTICRIAGKNVTG